MNQLSALQPAHFDGYGAASKLKKTYIPHPRLNQVEADLTKLLKHGSVTGSLVTSASVYLLTGTAGCGKTTILKRFQKMHPPSLGGPDDDTRPVVYVEVPPNATRKGLANAILDALEFRFRPHNATENQLFALLLTQLRGQCVRLLMLDESHGFVDRRSKLFNYEGAEWLKSLLNACVCPVVIAGCPDAELVYVYNDQLERRSFGSRRLEPFRYSSASDFEVFVAIVSELLSMAPGGTPLQGDIESVGMALHLVSGGHLGRLVDFLAVAFVNLSEGQHETIDPALLETAEQRKPCRRDPWVNPFAMEVGELVEALETVEKASDTGPEPMSNLRRGRRRPTQADIGC